MWQRKSDERWCERVVVNGKKKLLTARTQKELNRKIREIDTFAEHGRTFRECAEAWESVHSATIEQKTMQAYKPHIERAVAHFEGQYMKDITPHQIQAYVDFLAAQRFARDTVRRSLNVLKMVFNYEITSPGSLVTSNPCVAVKIQKGLKKERREPPTEEQLIKVSPDSDFGLFAYFLQFTGLRRGELLALKWEDIDFKNKVIHVRHAVSYASNQPKMKEPKTTAGNRDVALLDVLADVLPRSKKGYVFGGDKPLSATQFRKGWLSWCREVGLAEAHTTTHKGKNGHTYTKTKWIPKVTPHQFRHEYASILEDAGISEFAAKNLLGHSSIIVTKDIYTHIRERKAGKNVAGKLNDFIREKGKEKVK